MDQKLQDIVNKISSHIKPTKIYLFGSRARGDHHPDSDYDFVIIYDGDKSKGDVDLSIRQLFRRRDFAMDILVLSTYELERYKHVATTLEREITENGVLMYG
ncbi:nucleotidyltransferase domain-containing protein [bacterium]|nr:nucleotidyltransferase domain-containing protein [bacterium]